MAARQRLARHNGSSCSETVAPSAVATADQDSVVDFADGPCCSGVRSRLVCRLVLRPTQAIFLNIAIGEFCTAQRVVLTPICLTRSSVTNRYKPPRTDLMRPSDILRDAYYHLAIPERRTNTVRRKSGRRRLPTCSHLRHAALARPSRGVPPWVAH